MNDQPFLVSTCLFKGREYLVKMNVVIGSSLYLCVTDKGSAEEWQCTYDASYIENLTHKTGNYKQFDIFATMLKSGLLKTSECVSLDLLSYEDLEQLRNHRVLEQNTPQFFQSNHGIPNPNRRYLILTYSVEFDRIHYPLPMEYCGCPDPKVLQKIIRRLETEIARLNEKIKQGNSCHQMDSAVEISQLHKQITSLEEENKNLNLEIEFLNNKLSKKIVNFNEIEFLSNSVKMLEENFLKERFNYQKTIKQLRDENVKLIKKIEELSGHEKYSKLKTRIDINGLSLKRQEDSPEVNNSRKSSMRIRNSELKEDFPRGRVSTFQLNLDSDRLRNAQSEIQEKIRKGKYCKTKSSPIVNNHACHSDSSLTSGGKHQLKANRRRSCNVEFDKCFQSQYEPRKGRSKERSKERSTRYVSKSPMESPSSTKRGNRSNGSRQSSACSSSSCSHCSDRVDRQISSETVTSRAPRHRRKKKSLPKGISDLERRIQALQNILKDGLSMA
ncbi:hypothetical protein L9F63_019956 [Diploptera punctata]|uniref:Coiled-coil domain-containing protein 61 n=1 Tax=Diploptera punctata TaxID=6984 RepID=A0AAD7ZT73_DIPPU|nr:hypothetical protein L9F63_019956 [Diploptera punctata]